MAYRQTSPLVKLVILGLVVWGVWRYGVPWLKEQGIGGGSKVTAEQTPNVSCVSAADDAVAVWSRGIVRFMNPPLDQSAWGDFRAEVERKIDQARSACSCPSESCALANDIASDLRKMVSDMDAAARSGGPPPGDLVRAQESIDLKIEQAWKLAEAAR